MEESSEMQDVAAFAFFFKNLNIQKFKKPTITAGGVMAGSVATIAIVWGLLQAMGYFGHSQILGGTKLPFNLDNYLAKSSSGIPSGLPVWDNSKLSIIDTNYFDDKKLPPIDEKTLNSSIVFANSLVSHLQRFESNLVRAGFGLTPDTPDHNHFLHSSPHDAAMEKGIDALIAVSASYQLLNGHCVRYGHDEKTCARYISTLQMEGTPLGSKCASMQGVDCETDSKYRTIDGSCNNPQNVKWGSAMTAYTRLLFPQYLDGIQLPRNEIRQNALPNPRSVSVALTNQPEKADVTKTLALMQWSQFIAHDVSHTPVQKMVWTNQPISCCDKNGQMPSPRYIHKSCAAISISDSDPIYGKHRIRCLNYVRSLPVIKPDCTFGPTEQMNQMSHFLDGSAIYGSSLAKSKEIRSFSGGELKMNSINNKQFLPYSHSESSSLCKSENCYLSGDDRASSEPQLAVLHTLWHREHNRIAKKLASINPEWSDEILFQEARRIVVAEIQHITYKEWLPIVVGKNYARSTGLAVDTNYSTIQYSSYHDPAVSNELATAAIQFLHSLKQGKLTMTDNNRQINETLRLSDHYYKPRVIESDDKFDSLIRGMATQTVQKMDLHVVPDVSHELYKTNGVVGLDQISLDIQRGRDHGLPGYNDYRKHCGLKAGKTFDDFLDYIPIEVMKKIKELYKRPQDVDLIIGGMAEKPVDGASVGPTFRCLLTEHFIRTRRTDRYFYDSADQPVPFTIDQLQELKKVTLARIFCDNGDGITKMQPNVFLKPQPGNELSSCKDFEKIPSVDLFAWAEKAKAYR